MAEADTTMTDAPSEEVDNPSSPQVLDSIEVDTGAKGEGAADDAGSDAADNDAQDDGSDGRPVTNSQYKALKLITEVLSDFKIQKGGE